MPKKANVRIYTKNRNEEEEEVNVHKKKSMKNTLPQVSEFYKPQTREKVDECMIIKKLYYSPTRKCSKSETLDIVRYMNE